MDCTTFEKQNLSVPAIVRANVPFFVILLVLVLLVFGNGLNGSFISGDDVTTYVLDPQVRDLRASLSTLTIDRMLQGLNYYLFQVNPMPFHVLSLTFHFVNTALVFVFLYILTNKRLATISSLLFAVHPVVTEAVSWVSGKSYLFTAFFALLTLIYFTLYRKNSDKKAYYAALGLFTLGLLLSKQVWLLDLPLVITTVDALIIDRRLNFKRLLAHLPFFVISVISFLLLFLGPFRSRVENFETNYFQNEQSTPVLNRLPYTVFMSAKLLVFPIALSLYHEGEVISSQEYLLMILVTVLLGLAVIYFLRTKRQLYAGSILAIFFSLAPSFSPTTIAWFVAERYLYLGSVFFACILASIYTGIEKKYKKEKLTTILTVATLILFSIRTVIRTNDWKTSKSLWSATQKVSPNSYRVYNNLGDAYGSEGNVDMAIASFKKAIELNPAYADALHNLGNTYLQIKDYDNAKKYLKESFEANPLLYQALDKLGEIALIEKDPESARQYFEGALRINPKDQIANQALGTLN